MTTPGCEICERIPRINPDNPYFVAELETGFAVLGDNQHIPGYAILVCKTCVPELHDLLPGVRARFLDEMALLAEAVYRAFRPRKLNYELLGNSVSHMHWHIFPRYEDDANPRWPVWSSPAFLEAAASNATPDRDVLRERADALRAALSELQKTR